MNPIITIHDVSTDEIITREMTDDELLHQQDILKQINDEQNKVEQIAKDKAALLAKLGITADEAKLLLG